MSTETIAGSFPKKDKQVSKYASRRLSRLFPFRDAEMDHEAHSF